jgi:hypothetical protein
MSGLPARRKVEERTGGNDAVTEHAAGNHVDDSEASAAPFDPDAWKAFGRYVRSVSVDAKFIW